MKKIIPKYFVAILNLQLIREFINNSQKYVHWYLELRKIVCTNKIDRAKTLVMDHDKSTQFHSVGFCLNFRPLPYGNYRPSN